MTAVQKDIVRRLYEYEHPKRIALSRRYPFLKKPVLFVRHRLKSLSNLLDRRITRTRSTVFFPCVVARHQSVLRRKLGDSDARLQEQKIMNLRQAIKRINGLVIQPGQVFSFWTSISRPTYREGYVDGMLLANGRVVEGLGGGLCQLSNFLYWIFLHTPIRTIERHHHSMDVFPDSGRTLPFGGGATVLYNFVDLQLQNSGKEPLQLKIWLTDTHLKGQILSPHPIPEKFHVRERAHCFVKRGDRYFRYNQIYQEVYVRGRRKKAQKITTNFAPVLYPVTEEYLREQAFDVLDLTGKAKIKP